MNNHLLSALAIAIGFYCMQEPVIAQSSVRRSVSISPSPNASSLGVYGNLSVDYFSGRAPVQIPIYTVVDRDISLPITLMYQGGGVKVEDIASWVGIGWSLNAGGVITRTVRGLTDPVGGYYNSDVENGTAEQHLDDFLNLTEGYDPQPDLYSFNVNGRAGIFYHHQTDGFFPVPYQKLIFEVYDTDKLKMIDEKGFVYCFGYKEVTEKTIDWRLIRSGQQSQVGEVEQNTPTYISAWYLESIESPQGGNITFEYETESIDYTTKLYEEDYDMLGWCANKIDGAKAQVEREIDGYRLSKIEFSSGYILFEENDTMFNYVGNKALDYISLYNNNDELIREFHFYYDNPYDRLYLDSIQELNGSLKKNPYIFTYYGDHPGTNLNSYNFDYFGYPISGNNGEFNYYSNSVTNLNAIDHTPGDHGSAICALETIEYPTGGITRFNYEAHEDGTTTYGGARIAKITDYDPANEDTIFREFEYGAATLVSEGSPSYYYENCSGLQYYYVYRSYSNSSLGYTSGVPIGYDEVTVKYINGDERNGKTVYKFDSYENTLNHACGDVSFYHDRSWARGVLKERIDYREPSASNYVRKRWVINTNNFYHYSIYASGYALTRKNYVANKYVKGFDVDYYVDLQHQENGICYAYTKNSTGYYETVESEERMYDSDGSTYVSNITDYEYNYQYNLNVDHISHTESNGSTTDTYIRYIPDYNIEDSIDPNDATTEAVGISWMQGKHIISTPIETYTKRDGDAISGSIMTYMYDDDNDLILPYSTLSLETGTPIAHFYYSRISFDDPYYVLDMEDGYNEVVKMSKYDDDGNLLEYYKTNDVTNSTIYGYDNKLSIADAVNAGHSEIAYTSFEDGDIEGNWVGYGPSDIIAGGVTGIKCLYIDGAINCQAALDPNKSHIVSFYAKGNCTINLDGDDSDTPIQLSDQSHWKFYIAKLNEGNTELEDFDIPSSVYIDELRLYPYDAQMTTYTYDLRYGVTSVTDPNSNTTYYEHDALGRILRIRDRDRNILKQVDYKYLDE